MSEIEKYINVRRPKGDVNLRLRSLKPIPLLVSSTLRCLRPSIIPLPGVVTQGASHSRLTLTTLGTHSPGKATVYTLAVHTRLGSVKDTSPSVKNAQG